MKRLVFFAAFSALCFGAVIANSYRPRTLDEKVEEAELIVLGTATVFGEERVIRDEIVTNFVSYERKLKIEIKEVLWPAAFTNTNSVVFQFEYVKTWPESWWVYTNTSGVFFLTKNDVPARGDWDRLDLFNDWMESPTNAPGVRTSIKRLKKEP